MERRNPSRLNAQIAGLMMLYRKKAKKAPATPRLRAGSSMPAAPVDEAAAVPEVEEPEPASDPPVEVGLEPEEPDEPEEPAVPDALEPRDELEPPDVLLPLEVLLLPDPPIGVGVLPPVAVPLPAPDPGTTTGTDVVLDTMGWMAVGVPAGEVTTLGCVVTTIGCVMTAVGCVMMGVGWPVTTPNEFVRLVKRDAGWSF